MKADIQLAVPKIESLNDRFTSGTGR